jgi:hypothetical protein
VLAIVLSVLRFRDSDYPFGIFKHFLYAVNAQKEELEDTKGVIRIRK